MTNKRKAMESVDRTFQILETVREREPVSLTEVSNELGIAKSTIHRYLSALVSNGYLVRENNEYRMSFEFLSYSNKIHSREPAYPIIKRKVRDVADRTDEFVQFTANENDRTVYLFEETGRDGMWVGSYARTFRPLHSTAGGKSILSTWDRENVEKYIERNGLEAVTSHTITDQEALFTELEIIRERGYAINSEETVEGLGAISVPIKHANGAVIGSLGISGPISRIEDPENTESYADHLVAAQNELELSIRLL